MNTSTGSMSSKPSVLVVDDNDLTRTLLRSILRDSEFQVVGEAKNGVGALELAERLRPDIVCLDLMMPEMDGLEALQTIKTMYPEMVVVMITGSPSVDNVRESIQNGAGGFVIKPFNPGRVVDTVSRAWRSAKRPESRRESA